MSRDSNSSSPSREKAEELAPLERVETQYPDAKRVIPIMIALYMTVFLIALDQNIIAVAIPKITDEFHAINDIGWYASAFLLTNAAFQLPMGRVYKLYSPKWVLLITIALFEVGSAICGAAPNSTVLIVGRAIAGLGGSGIFSGLMTIMFLTLPLEKRPMYQGFFGAVFALASVAGPLLGGLFTDKVTWRWCFYINLPIGGLAMIIIFFILHVPTSERTKTRMGWKDQFWQLDPIGNLCLLPGVVCLLLALQWGGTVYPWKSGRIIALFIVFGILAICFVAVQIWNGEKAVVPPRIFKQRSIFAGMWYNIFGGGSMMVTIYYLPLWFQAVKNDSAVRSGIMLLPMILSLVVATISAGALTSRLGYYTPFLLISSVVSPIGAGLFTTFSPSTGHAKWIGYQVLYGFTLGLGMQQPVTAAQTVLDRKDISIGAALMFFARLFGGSIFVSVAENLFTNKLVKNLAGIPGLNPQDIVNAGALNIRRVVSADKFGIVLEGYNDAIRSAFILGVSISCMTIFGSALMEWRSVKAEKKKQTSAA